MSDSDCMNRIYFWGRCSDRTSPSEYSARFHETTSVSRSVGSHSWRSETIFAGYDRVYWYEYRTDRLVILCYKNSSSHLFVSTNAISRPIILSGRELWIVRHIASIFRAVATIWSKRSKKNERSSDSEKEWGELCGVIRGRKGGMILWMSRWECSYYFKIFP